MIPEIPGYLPIQELARGGMGAVWLAKHERTGRHVALKILLEDRYPDPRWRTELAAGSALRHPGIVQVLDSGLDAAGHPWLVMELVPGEELRKKLAREGPLPLDQVVRIGVELADALAHAHEIGIIHRDLKPGNIILRPDGRPVIIDLGLAKIFNLDLRATRSITETGTILGTPYFMAPEQALADKQAMGLATDIYGLGATLYMVLTGVPPVVPASRSPAHILDAVIRVPPIAPSRHRPDTPASLERVVLKCLEKRPGDRYSSMSELRDGLTSRR